MDDSTDSPLKREKGKRERRLRRLGLIISEDLLISAKSSRG